MHLNLYRFWLKSPTIINSFESGSFKVDLKKKKEKNYHVYFNLKCLNRRVKLDQDRELSQCHLIFTINTGLAKAY